MDRDAVAAAGLSPAAAAAFRAQPAADRAHALRVYRRLWRDGARDRDLLAAALLHDLGKSDHRASARLGDRVLRVLLGRLAPGLLRRLTSGTPVRPLRGLWLAVHHPRLGAVRAAELGCSARTCQLIDRHEAVAAGDPAADADLRRLIRADAAG